MNNYEFSHQNATPQSISSTKILIETHHHQSSSGDKGGGHGGISNANMVISQSKSKASLFEPSPPKKVTKGFQNDNPICHPQATPPTLITNFYIASSTVHQPSFGEVINSNVAGTGYPSFPSPNTNQAEKNFSGELHPQEEPVGCYEQLNFTNDLQEGLNSENLCLVKGQWTDEEDRRLKELVEEFGQKSWKKLSERMLGRVGSQCRERWLNHLRPDIKKDPWSEEEEKMLISAHKRLDNSWADIAKEIPGRAENSIKNYWNATRKKLCRRRNGFKWPRKNISNKSTPLLEYMNHYYTEKTSTISEHPTSTTIPTSIDTSIDTHHTMPTPETSHDPIAIDDTSDPMDLTLSRTFQLPITHDQDDEFIQFCEKLLQQ